MYEIEKIISGGQTGADRAAMGLRILIGIYGNNTFLQMKSARKQRFT